MERLMVLRLQVQGCEAQAWLNGVAIASATPARPLVCVPVHEYAVAGPNRLELRLGPNEQAIAAAAAGLPQPPTLQLAPDSRVAVAHILLPRSGAAADPGVARNLAECNWSVAAGEAFELPAASSVEVALPVNFPRWRWLEAPAIELGPVLRAQVLRFVQQLALDLGRGQTESFLAACRLRTEELALAYQRQPEQALSRLRSQLEQLYAAKRLTFPPLQAEALRLRPLAGGRLIECLDASGAPALCASPGPDGSTVALPLRLAMVEGKIYVLR